MSFAPGVSGNPAGRPPGAKNRKWADMAYWSAIIEDNLDALKPQERVAVAKWAMELLASHMKEIQSPDESKTNAEAQAAILKDLEAATKRTSPGS